MTEPIDFDAPTDKPEIPENHYAAIGRVAAACASLDLAIDYMIWELLGVDQLLGACVTAQFISIHPRLKALVSLAILRGARKISQRTEQFLREYVIVIREKT